MSELPKGWVSATLGDLADYLNGAAFKPSDWHESGRPIIRIQNLTDPEKPTNRTNRDLDSRYLVAPGDLLVSWSATLDAFIWDREESWLNQHIFKVTPNTGIDKAYLFVSVQTPLPFGRTPWADLRLLTDPVDRVLIRPCA